MDLSIRNAARQRIKKGFYSLQIHNIGGARPEKLREKWTLTSPETVLSKIDGTTGGKHRSCRFVRTTNFACLKNDWNVAASLYIAGLCDIQRPVKTGWVKRRSKKCVIYYLHNLLRGFCAQNTRQRVRWLTREWRWESAQLAATTTSKW